MAAQTRALWQDYLELCKPRVVMLMLLTALVGMLLATPGWVPWRVLVFGLLGIGACAAAGAVLNHLVDSRIDAIMQRTQKRPLPSGRLTARQAWGFAIILMGFGIAVLMIFVNSLTALLTFLTLVGYAGIYTLYLKRATPQNIVIGGAAGAAPPVLGWVAATNQVDPASLLLMLLIFVWTPPHFWALAIYRYKEYAQAKIPMLPVTHGIPFTKLSILLYTVLLLAVSILLFVVGLSGVVYLIAALLLGAGFIYYAVRLLFSQNDQWAMRTFKYSIWYLNMLFIVLLIDHYWV